MPSLILPLSNPVYRKLFTAQVVALLGTGLSTVALGLLAYEIAGGQAGEVLGVALALKMVSYVVVAPVIAAWASNVSRKRLLVCLDLIRALSVVSIAFVDQKWQIYVLVVVLSSASAGFTPTFQAVIPDVFEDVDTYTEALSLSRLAYEFEGLLSPALAAALLGLISYSGLFTLNAIAFLVSATLVVSTVIPLAKSGDLNARSFAQATSGIRRFLQIPRLKGLFALNMAAASASALVVVNTVLYVKDEFGLGDSEVAWGLGAAGAGSMFVALLLPTVLKKIRDRTVMIQGGGMLAISLVAASVVDSLTALLLCWFVIGLGLALVQTPAGRLIQRSGGPREMPSLFAAQFSLSHFCWLITYPIAGFIGSAFGLPVAALALAALGGVATVCAAMLWRATSPLVPSEAERNT